VERVGGREGERYIELKADGIANDEDSGKIMRSGYIGAFIFC